MGLHLTEYNFIYQNVVPMALLAIVLEKLHNNKLDAMK
jgi:hypothetical protein